MPSGGMGKNLPTGALTVLVFSAALIAPGNAAVFDQDDRTVPSKQLNSPYAPIGVVSPLSGLGSWALPRYTTGFLIDDCHMLTVQHLLGNAESPIGKRVRFTAGFTTPTRRTSHGTVVLAGGLERYSKDRTQYESERANDWMVVRLDQCIGQIVGHVQLQPGLPSSPVKSAGFPSNLLREPLKLDPSCRIRYRTTLLALNDCASMSGNSGSPIFQELKLAGRPTLVVYAMQTAGWNTGRKAYPFAWAYANVATPVSQIWPRVAAILSKANASQVAAR